MYSFLKGRVAYTDGGAVAIDVNGVGYEVFCTTRLLESVSEDEERTLYTHLAVKEDALTLYGFESRQEKAMFERMISISGIGPKAALSILSAMTIGEIAQAILISDVKAFSRVNGIGAKTAGRLVLELKDKVTVDDAATVLPGGAPYAASPESEAVDALMGLGYTRAAASAAVTAVQPLADTAEELTLMALKRLAM